MPVQPMQPVQPVNPTITQKAQSASDGGRLGSSLGSQFAEKASQGGGQKVHLTVEKDKDAFFEAMSDESGLSDVAQDQDQWHSLMAQVFGYDENNTEQHGNSEALRLNVVEGDWSGFDLSKVSSESLTGQESGTSATAAFVGGDTVKADDDTILVSQEALNAGGAGLSNAVTEELFHAFERKIFEGQNGDTLLADNTGGVLSGQFVAGASASVGKGAQALDEGALGVSLLNPSLRSSSDILDQDAHTLANGSLAEFSGLPVNSGTSAVIEGAIEELAQAQNAEAYENVTAAAGKDVALTEQVVVDLQNYDDYFVSDFEEAESGLYSAYDVSVTGVALQALVNDGSYSVEDAFQIHYPSSAAASMIDFQEEALGSTDTPWSKENMSAALGYSTVPGVTEITDVKARGALAFVLTNPAVFNALDSGSGNNPDGLMSQEDLVGFRRKYESDVKDALDWYNNESNKTPADALIDVNVMNVLAHKEILDTVKSGDDGDFGYADLQAVIDNPNPWSKTLSTSASFVGSPYNRRVLDTGSTPFDWTNPADGKITVSDIKDASGNLSISLDGMTSEMTRSLMFRVLDGDVIADDTNAIKSNIANAMMAVDGLELIASDPADTLASSATGEDGWLQIQMEEALGMALADPATAAFVEENLQAEFDRNFPPGSAIRNQWSEWLGGFRDYHTNGGMEEYIASVLEPGEDGEEVNIFDALQEVTAHLAPLKFLEDDSVHDINSKAAFDSLLFSSGASADEVLPEVHAQLDDLIPTFLPEATRDEHTDAESAEIVAELWPVLERSALLGKNVPELLTSWDTISKAVDFDSLTPPAGLGGWQEAYDKGYMHAASAAVAAGSIATKIANQEGAPTDADIASYTALASGFTADVFAGYANSKLKTLSTNLDNVTNFLKPMADQFPEGLAAKTLANVENGTLAASSAASKRATLASGFTGAGSAIAGVLSGISADEAFAGGDVVGGTLLSIDAAGAGLAVVGSAMEVMAAAGWIGSTAGAFGTGIAAAGGYVGAAAFLGMLLYSTFSGGPTENELKRDFRTEAEQVFRPDIVLEGATSWTAEEQAVWWQGQNGGTKWDWTHSVPKGTRESVSYTHLTLPTILRV